MVRRPCLRAATISRQPWKALWATAILALPRVLSTRRLCSTLSWVSSRHACKSTGFGYRQSEREHGKVVSIGRQRGPAVGPV